MKPGYTIAEDDLILSMLEQGCRPKDIAAVFPERTYSSVKCRISRLRHGRYCAYRHDAKPDDYGAENVAKMYDRFRAEELIADRYDGLRYDDDYPDCIGPAVARLRCQA